jgi:ComF family protein
MQLPNLAAAALRPRNSIVCYNETVPSLLRDVVDLVYPPVCVSCGADQGSFCPECSEMLKKLAATEMCPRCSFPSGTGASCPQCGGGGIFPFERIVALGPFLDPLRQLIHRMKYQRRWMIADILADRLLGQPRVREILDDTDYLLPIPLYWSKQISRGFNQADQIARRLSKNGPKVIHPLARTRNTRSQTEIRSREQRIENLRDAMAIADPNGIEGKRLTLVDDVITTAATLKSAANALNSLHPAKIDAILLCTADPKRRDFQVS